MSYCNREAATVVRDVIYGRAVLPKFREARPFLFRKHLVYNRGRVITRKSPGNHTAVMQESRSDHVTTIQASRGDHL